MEQNEAPAEVRAAYDSNQINQPGQYPAPSFTGYGLPTQDQGTGAAGSNQVSQEKDPGNTNEPGQYPAREDFTGMPLGGTGAPGTAGIGQGPNLGGGDSATYTEFDAGYKGERDDNGQEQGGRNQTTHETISGKGDWTQANAQGYQADDALQMPGVAGNTPAPGDGHFQTGGGRVLRGGFMNGARG